MTVKAMALSHVVAGMLETPEPGARLLHRPVDLVFNWIVPALLLWADAHYTQRVAEEPTQARSPANASGPPDGGPVRWCDDDAFPLTVTADAFMHRLPGPWTGCRGSARSGFDERS